jgi:hypothetical protein
MVHSASIFLAHFHRADFGGVGAAGTSGHHHADDQRPDLAQHQHRDHVDDVHVGAEGVKTDDPIMKVDSMMIGTARQPTFSM